MVGKIPAVFHVVYKTYTVCFSTLGRLLQTVDYV